MDLTGRLANVMGLKSFIVSGFGILGIRVM
jgi:hypothetical protein